MEKSFFFNAKKSGETYDRVYQAEDFASYFAEFVGNGVFPNPSTGLQVLENEEPGMTTVLKPGAAFINGYGYKNTADIVFEHKVADGSLDRKDAIFIRFDKAGRAIGAIKMEGSTGAEAVAPQPIRTADYYDLCVAIISVNAGISKITQDLIEDTRLSTDLCGIVHNVVDQIDTDTLYKQIQADLERFRNVSQAEFDAWFDDINAKLGEEPATALQQQIDEIDVEIPHLYKAVLLLDGWVGGSGFAYTQTVPLVPVSGGPQVDNNSIFCSGVMCSQTASPETNEALIEVLGIVNAGRATLGTGTITVDVSEKPVSEIEAIWQIKKGGT